jgi:hypothetical protein
MKFKFLVLLVGLLAATQLFAPNAQAQGTPALSFTGAANFGAPEGTFGWSFTLSNTITVTELGYFDFGGNGLSDAHDVGIWTSSGTLLVSATVPAGTAGTLNGDFRYVLVAATLLAPGDYVIGGFTPADSGDPVAVQAATITTASGISYDASRSIGGSSLTFPIGDTSGQPNSYFGPNFIFVPEPTTTALLLLGSSGSIVAWLRRRHNGSR